MNSHSTPNGICESYAKKKNLNYGAGKMAQWVKKLADKTDDLVPYEQRKNPTPGNCSLTSIPFFVAHMKIHMYTYTNK